MLKQKYSRILLTIFTLVALLYNSWPLAYILNPSTARYGLASDLDGHGQPYSWLFIWGDVLVGISLLAVCVYIGLKLKRVLWSHSWVALLVGLMLFGVFTATSAIAPTDCTQSGIPVCAHFDKRLFRADGIESAIAILGLFTSLLVAFVRLAPQKAHQRLARVTLATLILWPLSVVAFLIAGLVNKDEHLAQQVLLILAGLALLVVGLCINAIIQDAEAPPKLKKLTP